jgi:hypothetical protein
MRPKAAAVTSSSVGDPTRGGEYVTATLDLVERSYELKVELIEFSRKPRYEQALRDAASAHRVEVASLEKGCSSISSTVSSCSTRSVEYRPK